MVGLFGDLFCRINLVLQDLVVGAVAEQGDAGQGGGHDGHGHGHAPVEGMVGGVLGVFGFLDVVFGPLAHGPLRG